MRILIIRHGDPDYSVDSLTPQGFKEAHLLAEMLSKEKIDDAYCSILGRARDTAKETLERLGITAKYCDWLQEISYMRVNDPQNPGALCAMWDFMPRFFSNEPQMHQKDEWLNSPIIQGTDIPELYQSVTDQLDAVLREHGYRRRGNMYVTDKGNHDTVAFFCHLGTESVLLSHLLNVSPFIFLQNFFISPTSVTTLYTEERLEGEVSWRCAALGDTSHLYVAGEKPSFSGRFCECFADDTRH